jgi:hypothetical protein
MRIHDFSEIKAKDGKLSFSDRINASFKYGFSYPSDIAMQEDFIAVVGKDIDQRFTLLRNYPIKEIEVYVPLILVGPPGVLVIVLSRKRGLFRAKDDQWLEMSGKRFKPAKDNLIRRTQLYIRAVQKVLQQVGFPDTEIDGLLVGMHPGMTIDTQHPAVRAIQLDALRYWSTQIMQVPPVLSPERIYQIVAALTDFAERDEKAEAEKEAARRKAAAEPQPDKLTKTLAPVEKKLNFTTQQWIVLALLLFGTIAVLFMFMLIILLSL